METYLEAPARCARCLTLNPRRVKVDPDNLDLEAYQDERGEWTEDVYFDEVWFFLDAAGKPALSGTEYHAWECSNMACKRKHIKGCQICKAPTQYGGAFCEACYAVGYCTDCLTKTGNGDTTCGPCISRWEER